MKRNLSDVARKLWLRNHMNEGVIRCIEYLDLDKEGPNQGTKNKQELTIRLLAYLSEWKEGSYSEWKSKLATRLCITPRTVKENYLDPLIREGIIGRVGSRVSFIGPPESGDEG